MAERKKVFLSFSLPFFVKWRWNAIFSLVLSVFPFFSCFALSPCLFSHTECRLLEALARTPLHSPDIFLLYDIWRASTYVRAISSSSALTWLFVSFFLPPFGSTRLFANVFFSLSFSFLAKIPEAERRRQRRKAQFEDKKNESPNSERDYLIIWHQQEKNCEC